MFFEILIASVLLFNSKAAENALFQALSADFCICVAAFSLLSNGYLIRVKKHSPQLKKCIFQLRRMKKFKRIFLASIDFVGTKSDTENIYIAKRYINLHLMLLSYILIYHDYSLEIQQAGYSRR